mgnify:CR=1 FL=1
MGNITASKRFKPKTAEGSVEVKFDFDAKSLAGKSITIFEECMLDNTVIAVHKDLEDADQMIHFPKLKTSVKDEVTDMKMVKAEKDMRIIDTVEYHNLKKGKKYKITGTLMDKETGKAARSASGRKITESVEFVAEGKDGTAEVEFVFDGSNLAGKTLVAFEKLYYGDKLYAVHTDLEDEDQTIHVPAAGTTASDKNTGTHHAYAGEYVELTDTIEYRNLLPGETYTLHGTVVEKETEQRLSEEKQQEFIPEKADGSIEIAFEINGTDLSGKTAVIYEEIKIDGKSIAEHKNPEAKEQSIYFPKIGTKAMDKKSKTQEGDAREKQTIIDQVSYENLLPGETYILKGVLMDKADGKEMTDKNTAKVPIIMVTAKTSELDKVKGLDLGADDYISKPFGVMELISRVKALLRRTTNAQEESQISYGNILVDNDKHAVYVDGKLCELTYKEFELLKYLVINKGIVLSRDKIMNQVWGFDYEGESRTVDMHIKTLRQKLGEAGSHIKTVRNVGYMVE